MDKPQKSTMIPFEQAGIFHHMLVGKAPEGSSRARRLAVAVGTPVITAGVAAFALLESLRGSGSTFDNE
jgi:hypothetical protein